MPASICSRLERGSAPILPPSCPLASRGRTPHGRSASWPRSKSRQPRAQRQPVAEREQAVGRSRARVVGVQVRAIAKSDRNGGASLRRAALPRAGADPMTRSARLQTGAADGLPLRRARPHQAVADGGDHRARPPARRTPAATSSASRAGEPDFDTPANIRAAGKAAIDRGETRYTAPEGIPELRRADRRQVRPREPARLRPRPGDRLDRRQAGAVQRAARHHQPGRRGDRSRRPTGSAIPTWCGSAAARRSIVEGALETGFKITPEALAAAITPRTKWLIFNSPSNPTGAGYSAAELKALTDVLARASARAG